MMIRSIALFILSACFAFNVLGNPVAETYEFSSNPTVVSAEKYIRTELYFGLSRKGGHDISEEEFQEFIDEFVTPRFPSGLTILDGRGQWREEDSTITKEPGKVMILIYPRNERRSADKRIEEIRAGYKKRYSQESVLRLDMTKGVKVDF